ncbi:MAG: family 20 glycosylhydrolase [Cyclobacteriaceae bacterium]|nr:family 20 glycosylhydrolase [Cyclobacteriaceae bacterium]
MKRQISISLFLFFCHTLVYTQSPLQLIPQPVSVVNGKGNFSFTASTKIIADDDALPVAEWLQSFLQKQTGYETTIVKNGVSNAIQLLLNKVKNEKIGHEGYQLFVTASGIKINANEPAGLFNGVQTLLQLFPPDIESAKAIAMNSWSVPAVEVTDYPRFAWRGLMLDVSRHFFTINEVKKMVDEMARYKFNILHLHLTDDQGWRMEIKSYPKLTTKGAWRAPRTGLWWERERPQPGEANTYGGFYTQQQLKELVAYCAAKNIQVMPEIDVPGHSLAAAASYAFLSCTKQQFNVNAGNRFANTDDNAFCAGNDSSYQFLEKVIAEVAAVFPYKYIHIGGDECNKSFWSKCPVCQQKKKTEGLSDENELQSYFIKRVEKIVEANGKILMGWDEILEGGLAPNASVMSWRGMKGGIEAAKQNHQVVMTPTDYCYLDLYQGDPAIEPPTYSMLRFKTVYEFEPVPNGVKEELIVGGQGNLWTESVPQFRHAEYMLWPRSLALAEVLWSPKSTRNWNDFLQRTEQHLHRLNKADINYASSFYDAVITTTRDALGKLKIQLNTELEGLQLYYTFDDTYPDAYAKLYQRGKDIAIEKDANTFRVVTYRNGKQLGRIISVQIEELEKRTKK